MRSLAGFAGRRWLWRGAGSGRVGSSLGVSPVVASWSRLPDLFGQIWCVLVWVFFAASIRWQGLGQAGELRPGISTNKASSSFSVLACLRGAGRWLLDFCAVSPRRKADGESSNTCSVNQRFHLLHSFLTSLLAPLAGRGGEGERGKTALVAGVRRWWEIEIILQPAVHSRWYKFYRRLRWPKGGFLLPDDDADACSTSMWRPCEGREAAHIFNSGPSGLVLGAGEEGRRCCPQFSGGAKDSMVFFFFIVGSFLLILRSSKLLSVSCRIFPRSF